MMLADLEKALSLIRETLEVEPEKVGTVDAGKVFAAFLEIERAAVAGKTMFARRAAESGEWRRQGYRNPESWVAQTTGSGLGEARNLMETAERLVSLPATSAALRRGELSAQQLQQIAATAAEKPSAEEELIAVAGRSGLKGLKDECRRVKARAMGESEARVRYEEIRKNRSLIMWTDSDGVGRVEARLTPDGLGRLMAGIQSEANAIFAEARKSGQRESPAAYAADALIAFVTGTNLTGRSASASCSGADGDGGGGSRWPRPSTTMHLRVDVAALRRGELEDGEVCEIPGVGPVPLATATNAIGEAVLRVIVTDGVDVKAVANMKRAIPARLRTALIERDPTCVVPGCHVARGLENDHYQIDFIKDGPTEMWNLCRLCHWHHLLKTHGGYAIRGGPGEWEWHAPQTEENPVLTS